MADLQAALSEAVKLNRSISKFLRFTTYAQLAREIKVVLPVELSPAQQLALVRSFVKDNFVDAGMCADFAIHDKGTGNPHAHIMLTIRPLKPDGRWGPKCRKVYDLDSQGNRIPDGKQELGDQLLRRKELYEMLHPETRQGMRNGQTSKNANLASLETKSFAQDTSEKLRRFIKEIKAASAENESRGAADAKGEHDHEN